MTIPRGYSPVDISHRTLHHGTAEKVTLLEVIRAKIIKLSLCDLETGEFLAHFERFKSAQPRKGKMAIIDFRKGVHTLCPLLSDEDILHLDKVVLDSEDEISQLASYHDFVDFVRSAVGRKGHNRAAQALAVAADAEVHKKMRTMRDYDGKPKLLPSRLSLEIHSLKVELSRALEQIALNEKVKAVLMKHRKESDDELKRCKLRVIAAESKSESLLLQLNNYELERDASLSSYRAQEEQLSLVATNAQEKLQQAQMKLAILETTVEELQIGINTAVKNCRISAFEEISSRLAAAVREKDTLMKLVDLHRSKENDRLRYECLIQLNWSVKGYNFKRKNRAFQMLRENVHEYVHNVMKERHRQFETQILHLQEAASHHSLNRDEINARLESLGEKYDRMYKEKNEIIQTLKKKIVDLRTHLSEKDALHLETLSKHKEKSRGEIESLKKDNTALLNQDSYRLEVALLKKQIKAETRARRKFEKELLLKKSELEETKRKLELSKRGEEFMKKAITTLQKKMANRAELGWATSEQQLKWIVRERIKKQQRNINVVSGENENVPSALVDAVENESSVLAPYRHSSYSPRHKNVANENLDAPPKFNFRENPSM
eukprot:g5453.t1